MTNYTYRYVLSQKHSSSEEKNPTPKSSLPTSNS